MTKSSIIKFFLLLIVAGLTACGSNETVYTDPEKPVDERVQDLLSRMTVEEKIGQFCQYLGPAQLSETLKKYSPDELLKSDSEAIYSNENTKDIIRLIKEGKIGSFLMVNTAGEANLLQSYAGQSRLQIPLLIGIDAIHGHGFTLMDGTIFPASIGLASSFDTTMAGEMAEIVAEEMRATGYQWTFFPNVDVGRDPRWGRIEETFGEDPMVVSAFGKIFTQKLQNNPDPSKRVAACAKHYIAGSQPYNGLNFAPENTSEREIREIFLPPFEACVDAGLMTVMAAHHSLNGVPCHANEYILQDLLKEELGFEGFVVSDWSDIQRLHTIHKVAESPEAASVLGFTSGVDMHMHGPGFFDHILQAYNEGLVSEERINDAARRILKVKFELGLFENAIVDLEKIDEHMLTEEHKAAALDAAKKTIMLMKNDKNVLPLRKNQKLFLTGPAANSPMILGDWVKQHSEEQITTIYEGLQERLEPNNLVFEESGDIWSITDEKIKECKISARNSDVIIVAVGENSYRGWKVKRSSGENMARAILVLPGNQEKLIQELATLGKPVVVLLVSGRPLVLDNILPSGDAILNCWIPGMTGGTAITDILYGDFNPGAKSSVTFPPNIGSTVNPYNERPGKSYRKYADSPSDSKFPFGYGLSYTEYSYDSIIINDKFGKDEKNIVFDVVLTNKGEMDGTESILVFMNDLYASVAVPEKKLVAFRPVDLKAGEQKTVSFSVDMTELALLDKDLKPVVEPGIFRLMISNGGNTSSVEAEFKIE